MKKFVIYLPLFLFIACQQNEKPEIKSVTQHVIQTVAHRVLQNVDMNEGRTKRKSVKIEVDHVLTSEEIRNITKSFVTNFKSNKVAAAMIYFYKQETDINGAYNAGMAVWAPFGKWEKAGDVKSGDYSSHMIMPKLSKEVIWQDKTEIPLAKRKKIFFDIVAKEDALHAQGVNVKDHVAKAVQYIAKMYNIPIEQVKAISGEGVVKDWPMPEI